MRTDTRNIGGDLIPLKPNGEKPRFQKFSNRVALVCGLLEQRQGDVCSEEMVAILECSERQARRVFHYIAGESFRFAQVRARLYAAKFVVQHSPIPISEISESFGYSRRAKFDKSYESVFGITPAADRAASRNQKRPEMATQGVDTDFQQVYRAAPTTER